MASNQFEEIWADGYQYVNDIGWLAIKHMTLKSTPTRANISCVETFMSTTLLSETDRDMQKNINSHRSHQSSTKTHKLENVAKSASRNPA